VGKPGHALTSSAKPNIHDSKLLLCILWDKLSVLHYKLLKSNATITEGRYRLHLNRALKERRPLYEQRNDKVIVQYDNARPHVAQLVKTYLEMLKWEILPHAPYSPYCPFRLSLVPIDGLADQHFHSYENAKK